MNIKYLDQNISDVISKNERSSKAFQKHIFPNGYDKNTKIHTTPFSLVEYSGLKPNDIVENYKIKVDDEFDQNFVDKVFDYYDKKIDPNIQCVFLKELEEKKQYVKTQFGRWLIDRYIEYVKDADRDIRKEIVGVMSLDRFASLNFSIMAKKKGKKIYRELVKNIPEMIINQPYLNFTRLVLKSVELSLNESSDNQEQEQMKQCLDTIKFKSNGDLIDTEIPHLAVFGNSNQQEAVAIYTSDNHESVHRRSSLYFKMLVTLTREGNQSLRDMRVDSTIFCIDKKSFIRGEITINKEIKMRDIYKESKQSKLW